MTAHSFKCVVIGDGFVGKTSLLMSLCNKDLDETYTPTVFDNYVMKTNYNGQSYEILFIDTAGQEEYNLLRKQVYESASVFLVCFDVSNTDSFSNVKELWLPEIGEYSTSSKILIGTKSDLRINLETIDKLNANGRIFVNQTGAKNFAEQHKMKYIECSSKTRDNVPEVLKTMTEVHTVRNAESKSSSSSCCLCVNPIMQLAKRALCCRDSY